MKLLAQTELSRPHAYLYCQTSQASLFVSKNTAFCSECGNKFTFSKVNPFTQKIYCSKCGRGYDYKKDEVIISKSYDVDLPYITKIKLYELKEKIELRIYYKSISISQVQSIYSVLHFSNIREIYTFDIKNQNITFKKYINNVQYDKQDIGYITDLENLTENTALYFFKMNTKNYYFDSLTVLLKKLRTAIIKKVYQVHNIKLSNVYVNNLSKHEKFLGNILNLAHRVRFFNSPNIIYNKDFNDIKTHVIDEYLSDFEKKYADKLRKDYTSTIFDLLKLPNIKFLKQHFSLENLSIINTIYNNLNKDLSNNLFRFYLENEKGFINKEYRESYHSNLNRRIDKLYVYIDFINKLYLKYYKNVKLNVIFNKYNYIKDILNLYKEANLTILNKLEQENIAFSKLHNWLALEIAKQPEKDFKFDIATNIIDKYDVDIKKYHFSCVKKYSNLKEIAYLLNNCSAGYKNLINDRLQLIAIADDEGVKALIEISNNCIIQAKLYNNVPANKNSFINNLIITFAKEIGLKINTTDVIIDNYSLLNKAS